MYRYRAIVQRVVDGDTYDLVIDVGFYMTLTTRVRLRGVDTPEVRGESRAAGLVASAWVKERLPEGCAVLVRTYKMGKFGRYIADVYYVPGAPDATAERLEAEGIDLAGALLAAGMAVVMEGGV